VDTTILAIFVGLTFVASLDWKKGGRLQFAALVLGLVVLLAYALRSLNFVHLWG
jgi:hypothetical protein